MKSIVIFNSQTGFTKKYAEWISEAAGSECVALKKAKKIKLADYDAIVFGSWLCAGGISKLAWFKKQIPLLSEAGKKLLVYAVGGIPAQAPDIPEIIKRNFTDSEYNAVKTFYCPGGYNYEKMSLGSRMMMKMFVRILKQKKDLTKDDIEMIKMISNSYDMSDKKYVEGIVELLK